MIGTRRSSSSFKLEDRAIEFTPGDTFAIAMLRAGIHPGGGGGCLCLAGDCPNCLCLVNGEAYVRSCQTPAEPDAVVQRQSVDEHPPPTTTATRRPASIAHVRCDVLVVGEGVAGLAEAQAARAAGRVVVSVEAARGEEAIGVYPGPLVGVRTATGMRHVHPREIVIATGAAEEQPVCPGNDLEGIFTARAARKALASGVELGRTVSVGEQPAGVPSMGVHGRVVRFEGSRRVTAVVVRDADGNEMRHPCDTVIVGLGRHPRDALARMLPGPAVRAVGSAAEDGPLPPAPEDGVVCRCAGVTVDDLRSVWDHGFHEVELVKRATLACTGTCQGSACLPHVRAFINERKPEPVTPAFTARPLIRQLTLEHVAVGARFDQVRRTALDDEHRELGARMERSGGWWRPWSYGDAADEYRAVREEVSVCDVGTLGKIAVAGPDVVEFLERLYPCSIDDLAPGFCRYALILDERGYIVDDGLVCRDGSSRFFLTFSTAGAATSEMWLRDWAETWRMDVRILDRTTALGAINVTGPLAPELLERANGGSALPLFLHMSEMRVAGIECRAIRVGFTGEVSFELHHPVSGSVELWRTLLELGRDLGIRPHGLETLLTLRLEKGHAVVGVDTELDSTPRRLGLEWIVSESKAEFIGQQALARIDLDPLDRRLVGFELPGDAPPDGAVLTLEGELVGHLTSARWSSTLGVTVALGWLRTVDGMLPDEVECAGQTARRVPLPFYDPEGLRARA